MADRQNRIMKAQYKVAIRERDEFLKFYMDEKNVQRWYILLSGISGNDGEFESGQYLVRMEFDDKFPIEPPWFYFMTPNGVYDCETKVCVSIGKWHKNDYPAALGASGFAKNLVSGMVGWEDLGDGVSLLKTSVKKKKELARDSLMYNALNNAEIIDKINNAHASYSVTWGTTNNDNAHNK